MPYFHYNEINLYYEIAGGGPPLLLINGLGSDTRQWQPLISQLVQAFKIVSYDMRCAGLSDKPDAHFTISELADEVYQLMKHLGFEKYHVLGFSMGGMVALDLSLRYPDAIDKMFLVATAPSLKRPYPIPANIKTLLKRTDISAELLTQVYEVVFGPVFRKKMPVENFINFRLTDTNPQPASAYLNQFQACESCDLCDQVEKCHVPTVIIAGDADMLIPAENSRWLHRHITGSKLFILNGIGHMVPVEAPNRLAYFLLRKK